MNRQLYKTEQIFSIVIAVLATIASLGGLGLKNLYRDNAFVKAAWFTNDMITLAVAVPLLIIAVIQSKRGSLKWMLIWVGLLGYMFYNLGFYLLGAAFNLFFLIYTFLFSLSGFTMLKLLWNLSNEPLAQQFSERVPVKTISLYLLLMPLMLFIAELSMIIPFITSGKIPETIIATGHPTSVVFALDFSIIIPAFTTAAVLLWQRKAWGYILATMMPVKGFTYGLVLSIGTAFLAYDKAYGKWDPLMPLYAALTLGGLPGCWFLLKTYKSNPESKAI
ncbi:MAG: hypothetical protein K2X48_13185 [Chitinophagaceae bacterium]|nr:hypothetical protein [Chitinophagaceae bacterium]